jgi:hypothetical protein
LIFIPIYESGTFAACSINVVSTVPSGSNSTFREGIRRDIPPFPCRAAADGGEFLDLVAIRIPADEVNGIIRGDRSETHPAQRCRCRFLPQFCGQIKSLSWVGRIASEAVEVIAENSTARPVNGVKGIAHWLPADIAAGLGSGG